MKILIYERTSLRDLTNAFHHEGAVFGEKGCHVEIGAFMGYDCDVVSEGASAGTSTPFSSNSFDSSPFWCIDIRMSQPPTKSLST